MLGCRICKSLKEAIHGRLLHSLLPICRTNTSAVGKMITPTLLIGILLVAGPVVAQIDGDDPAIPPWQRPPSRNVVHRYAGPPNHRSSPATARRDRNASPQKGTTAPVRQRSSADSGSSVAQAGFYSAEESQTSLPARQPTPPDYLDEESEMTPNIDGYVVPPIAAHRDASSGAPITLPCAIACGFAANTCSGGRREAACRRW